MAILPLHIDLQKQVKRRKKIYDLIIVIISLILNLFQKIFPSGKCLSWSRRSSTLRWTTSQSQLLNDLFKKDNLYLQTYISVIINYFLMFLLLLRTSMSKSFAIHAALTIDRWLRSHLEDGVQANVFILQRPSFPWSSQENTWATLKIYLYLR